MPLGKFAKSAAKGTGFVSARPLYALGGLNEDENPRSLAPTDLVRAVNCARRGSTTGTRPGLIFGDGDWSAVTVANKVQGIHEFSYARGTREIVAVINGNAYTAHDATALDKATNSVTISASTQWDTWTFADFQDKMFAAGGTDGDDVWYYAGASAALNKIAFPTGFEPKFIFAKWNFMFLGGMRGASATTYDNNPLLARYCDYATDATDVTNWPSTNVLPGQLLNENFGVGSFGSEYNTGFGEFFGKDLDFLLFLTNKRIMAYIPNNNITGSETAFKLSNTIPIGCVSQNAFVNLGADAGDAVFLNKDGIHSLAQSRQYGDVATNYLSYPIRRTFQDLNQARLEDAWGAYWPQEGMVLFSVSTGSNSTNNLILCMDIKGAQQLSPETVRWYKWYLTGVTPKVLKLVRGTDGRPYVYVGTDTGEVCNFDRDVYQDLDSSGYINADFQTKNDDFDIPHADKKIGNAYIMLQGAGGGTVQHTIVLDDGKITGQTSLLEVPVSSSLWGPTGSMLWGTSLWGSDKAIRRHTVPGTGAGITVGHRFVRGGANRPFFVALIDQQVKQSGSALDQEANTVS